MWDSVPWFVGGGAQHSPEVARLLAFAATGGAEGIVAPGDLKVAPLDVPGSSIRVLSGAALLQNKAAGGTQQTYVGRNPSEDVVPIAATGSGSGRSDLIVARVEDPNMPGEPWATPSDVTKGPYIFTRVIPNVAPGTTQVPSGTSGIPLARIDIPANTSTISSAYIKDLRKLARPRTSAAYTVQAEGGTGQDFLTLTQTAFRDWPQNSFQVEVPTWATHASAILIIGYGTDAAACDGNVRVNFGGLTGPVSIIDHNGTGPNGGERHQLIAFGEFDVTALRGTVQTVKPQAARTSVQNTGPLYTAPYLQIAFDIRFSERAV